MDPELQEQAAAAFRRAVEMGATQEQAVAVARRVLGVERPSVAGGVTRSAAQGFLLGASDEARGLVEGIGALVPGGRSPVEAFREGSEAERTYLREFGEDHPFLRGAADVAGGLGAAALSGGLALGGRGAVTAGRLARLGAAEGVVVGGIEGAARAEGGLANRAVAGAGGAVAGGVLGGVAGALTPAISRHGATVAGAVVGGGVGHFAGDSGFDTAGGAAAGAGVGRLGGQLGGRLAARISRAVGDAGPATAGERASIATARSLGREGVTPEQLTRVASEAPETNLLGLTGRTGSESATQRLARGAQSIPSRGSSDISSFLARESDEAPERIRQALQGQSGLKFENAYETLEDLAERQASAARPLYDKAHAQSVPSTVLGDIDLASDDVFREAYEGGRRAAQREGFDFPTPEQIMEGAEIPVRAIDYMKSNVQELVRRGLDSGRRVTGRESSAVNRQLSGILKRTDDIVPEFGQARSTWAGMERAQELMEAAMSGGEVVASTGPIKLKAFLNESPEKIERVLKDLSPSDRQMYLRGAIEDVRDMLARREDTRADLSRLLIGRSGGDVTTTDLRRRLRLLFDTDRDMQEFVRSMLDERGRASASNFILGGSPTQRIAAEQADLTETVAAPDLNLSRMAVDVLRRRTGAYLMGLTEGTVDELAPRLTGPVSETVPTILRDLDTYGNRLRARTRVGARAGSANLGALVGSEIARDDRSRRQR